MENMALDKGLKSPRLLSVKVIGKLSSSAARFKDLLRGAALHSGSILVSHPAAIPIIFSEKKLLMLLSLINGAD